MLLLVTGPDGKLLFVTLIPAPVSPQNRR